MQEIIMYLRADSVKATLVDEFNNTSAQIPAITRGLQTQIKLNLLNADGTSYAASDLTFDNWSFAICNDWDTTTSPQILVTSGITTSNNVVTIPLIDTNTTELVNLLGVQEQLTLGCELIGYASGTTPGFIIQFSIIVRNRRYDTSTPTPSPVTTYVEEAPETGTIYGRKDGEWVPSGGTSGVSSVNGQTGDVTLTKSDIGLANVNNTSDANKPLSTATQTALNGKVDKVTGKGLSTNDYTTAEKTKLAGIAAGAQVNTVTSVANKTGAVTLTKSDVELSNVDNTSDADKPISTATQTALNGKVDKVTGKGLSTNDYTTAEKTKLAGIAAGAQVNTVTSVANKTGDVTLTKSDVSLGNVDNTSDANKPISTAVQSALDGKANTTDMQTALDGKLELISEPFTYTYNNHRPILANYMETAETEPYTVLNYDEVRFLPVMNNNCDLNLAEVHDRYYRFTASEALNFKLYLPSETPYPDYMKKYHFTLILTATGSFSVTWNTAVSGSATTGDILDINTGTAFNPTIIQDRVYIITFESYGGVKWFANVAYSFANN